MANKNWMFYAAYAVLVVGAGMALGFSARPLSATVVTWALFSFNTAAIIFLVPAVMNFVAQMRTPSTPDATLLNELRELKEKLSLLTALSNSDRVSLPDALEQTRQNTPLAVEPDSASQPAQAPATDSPMNIAPAPIAPTVPAATPLQQADLFSAPATTTVTFTSFESDTPASVAPVASAPDDALIVASIHVEEDDVLCLRGEGPGLNWQEGVPMNYDGEDKWSYKASQITTPITCRIYLNDDISAFGDDLVLAPGQILDVSPSFPKVEA